MAEKKSAKKGAPKSAKNASSTTRASDVFSAEEKAAMRDYVKEKKAAARGAGQESDESAVLAKIAEMSASDRAIGERLHALIKAAAPGLASRLWYGMPAYAKDGTVLCFFQPAQKFKTRYATFGFSDKAKLDEGDSWPTSFAVKELTAAVEGRIGALVKRAAG